MDDFLGNEVSEESLEEQDSGVWLAVGDLMSGLLMFFALLFIAVSAQLVEYDNIIKKFLQLSLTPPRKSRGLGIVLN
ncbi:hypothetical protein [Synechocystis salina]|uniref:hypothetical protein n=1 Tax=Synechocystis salina TaxID=945780 RepID=UPI001D14405F|nr:hypothetical protein [Synechocystis salina]